MEEKIVDLIHGQVKFATDNEHGRKVKALIRLSVGYKDGGNLIERLDKVLT